MRHYTTMAVLVLLMAAGSAGAQEADFGKYVGERAVYTDIDPKASESLRAELVREVEKMLAAGETLAPVSMQRGIGGQAVLWGNPAETVDTLCEVADQLPGELKAKAMERAKALVAKYPLWAVGWEDGGVRRDLWPVPDDLAKRKNKPSSAVPLSNLYVLWLYAETTGDWKTVQDNWKAISDLYKASFSAIKPAGTKVDWGAGGAKGKTELSGAVPEAVEIKPGSLEIRIPLADKSEEVLKDDGQGILTGAKGGKGKIEYKTGVFSATLTEKVAEGDTMLKASFIGRSPRTYGWVAGVIGYARMAKHIQADGADRAWTIAAGAVKEVQEIGYSGMYKMAFSQFGKKVNHDWMYPPFHVRRDGDFTTSCLFCPEVGRLLNETARDEIRAHIDTYMTVANTRGWFLMFGDQHRDALNTTRSFPVAGGESTGGENSFMPPDFGWTFYMLHAYVLKESPEQLKLWIDIPWAKAGDLYHMQRLLAAIRAYGKTGWKTL